MRKAFSILTLCFLFFHTIQANTTVTLDIPPRKQWTNSNGYCGSCSIQMAALHFGNYISQDRVRKCVGDKEILLGRNLDQALDNMRLARNTWTDNYGDFCEYATWIKQMLLNRYPVIYACRLKHSNTIYDHIIIAKGIETQTDNQYDSNDVLFYNDCFEHNTLSNPFSQLISSTTRWHLHPRYHFASAVTGIRDNNNECLPVSVSIDRWDEPNVSTGQSATTLDAVITIRSLEAGKTYTLLRFDDHRNVPVSDFDQSAPAKSIVFTAQDSVHQIDDSFESDGEYFYRCIQSSPPQPKTVNRQISHFGKDRSNAGAEFVYHAGTHTITIEESDSKNLSTIVYSPSGKVVRSYTTKKRNSTHTVSLKNMARGVYFVHLRGSDHFSRHMIHVR